MKSLAKIIELPGARVFLFVIVLLLLIWFAGPLLSMHGESPFSSFSSRLILSVAVVLIALVYLLVGLFLKHKVKAFAIIRESFSAWLEGGRKGYQYVVSSFKARILKTKGNVYEDKVGRQLRKIPWYLVIGPRASGKSTLMTQSGLNFKQQNQLSKEAISYLQQYPDYDWWFTDDNVFIDIAEQSPLTQDEEIKDSPEQQKMWQQFVKLLHKKRKIKPISGVIVTFNLIELLLKDNTVRQKEIYRIFTKIRQIHSVCKVQVPIYITFTKCDLIEGFVQFYNDLSREELEQVWGITIPLNQSMDMNRSISYFNKEYQNLISSLIEKIMWKVDAEKNDEKRELIYTFPQQMKLFQKTIENFMAEIFGAIRYPKAVQLRGVYFTSGAQMGKTHDMLMSVFTKKYHLGDYATFTEPKPNHESYFIHSVFKKVLTKDSKVLGYSNKVRTFRSLSYRTAMLLLPTLAVTGIAASGVSYKINRSNIKSIDQNITEYKRNYASLAITEPDIKKTLPTLNSLKTVYDMYEHTKHPWIVGMLPAAQRIKSKIDSAFARSINTLFLPRVAVKLEEMLHEPLDNANILYSVLKAYLAFSPTHSTSADAIIEPMTYIWSNEFKDDKRLQKQLHFYLQQAASHAIEKLPLDRSLINNTRSKLVQVNPERRAYELLILKSNVRNISSINFMLEYTPNFDKVFVAKNNKLEVPAFYTKAGYQHVFIRHFATIAGQVAKDNRAIGLTTSKNFPIRNKHLVEHLQKDYTKQYTKIWQHYLQNFSVVHFANYDQAISTLEILVSDQSPLADILNAVQQNTASLKLGDITIADNFTTLNKYIDGQKPSKEMQKINKTLGSLKDYLTKIEQSANQQEAAFKAAQHYMTGDLKDPIRQITLEAKAAPAPLRNWLTSIANQSWSLVLSGAMGYINNAWNRQVMQQYNAKLKGRYPLYSTAKSQASVQAFADFFAPKGLLNQFFNQYLVQFVNTGKSTWQLYRLNGHALPISPAELSLFQQATIIGQRFFPEGGNKPKLQFSIQPRTLDDDAKSVDLLIAGSELDYRHGPEQTKTITWPVSIDKQAVKASIIGFADDKQAKDYYGPWAIFQLIADGVIHEGAQADRYVFTINLGHYKSSFSVLTTDSLAVLRLEGLKGYHLPDKLGMSAAASSSVKVNTPALLSAEFPAETPEGLALSSVSIGE